jgi:endonuclease G
LNNLGRKLALFSAAVVMAFGISDVFHPSLALTNSGVITTLGTPLTENFDTLAQTGTAITWTDNSTIPGLFTTRPTYNTGTGSSNAGALYSFGVAGTNPVTDRALGSVGSGATGTVFLAVKLTNNTGATITSLDVAFAGEQWRNGGATAPAVSVAQAVDFQYQVANAGTITGANTPNTGWLDHNLLDFSSPTFGTSAAAALDGNAAANRVAKSSNISVSVAPGQEVWLRWLDVDHTGNDHGLAIDDLVITANGIAPVDNPPSVSTTSPVNGATNVTINSNVVITFNEPVKATASAFALECPSGSPRTFTQSPAPLTTSTSVTLTPSSSLPNNTVCTVTVHVSQITDTDGPADPMASDHVFSFTTIIADTAPAVTHHTPADNATGVWVGSSIVIRFSESVTAGAGAFAIDCSGPQAFTASGSPSSVFILNPAADLPSNTLCTVSIEPAAISDTDTNDPPNNPAPFSFSFTTAAGTFQGANVIINEIDADTPGSDTREFIELYDGGTGNTPLDGLAVVLYTGADANTPADEVNESYTAFDLSGFTTDANGYFVLGNPNVPGVDLIFAPGQFGVLQNGFDAVGLYIGSAADFPFGTPVTTANLQDAIVYGTDDADEPTLMSLLNPGQPSVNENAGGSGTTHSNMRCENGSGGALNTSTYRPGTPSPDAANTTCPSLPAPGDSTIVISQLYGGGGNGGATYHNDYVELYNRGAAPVDITGWSLQYASATGSAWDFNRQPLAGSIVPGEYYLVALAAQANSTEGAPLPPANITGGLINMSATAGKIALVDNFVPLAGLCPKYSVHLRDLVGYGTTASCREGTTNAPAASNTTALFRKLGGATDTDQNSSDFQTGAPSPRQTAPIVELGPYLINTDPQTDATDAPRDATIVVTFTEPVTVSGSWFNITCATSGPHNDATTAGGGNNHYITPNVNFVPGEECSVTIFASQISDVDTDDSGPNSDHLTADYSWSFTVVSGTAPPYTPDVHLTFGNPTAATADTGQPDNFLMAKPEFALSYNRDLGRPNWVSWHLSDDWYGTLARVDTFRADPEVPPDWYRVQSFDFSGSGFDRGHMVPNADRDKETSVPINQATFLMTNMVAQSPDNNQGPWAAFEGYLRTQGDAGNEMYIVAGGYGQGGTGSNGFALTVADGHVSVPAQTWKVALVLPKAPGDDLTRVTCSTRTLAVLMPNIQGIRTEPWQNYLTTVNAVESLVGYDLFSNLPANIQYCIEAGIDGVGNLPLDDQPPSISCAPADGAWHNDNVGVSCTATDSGSGLAIAGDASFVLGTTVTDGVEDGNASTDSHVVCDKAGNCATAGPIAGNKIDRKAPTITGAGPDGQWHATNVSLAHTATDGGSGLAIAADASFALVTSVGPDTEDANASTNSRNVCDAVGNCATAGPIAGNKIDRKAPSITLTTPPNGAVYQLNRVVIAAFSCADTASGLAACDGTVANGAAINTASIGAKVFAVSAVDAVGNATSVTVNYTVAANTIAINNLPAAPLVGDSFTPTFAYAGDGATSVTSNTPSRCTVSGGTVTFIHKGKCKLVAHATATASFDAATGAVQQVVVDKDHPDISIANIPVDAVNGGSFVPAFDYDGDGVPRVRSETPAVCRVRDGEVRFVAGGTCTLTPIATRSPGDYRVEGDPQSFNVGPAATTISIRNIPNKPKAGRSFEPRFDYDGDGATSVSSSTPSVCTVSGDTVNFLSAGTCTLTAHAAATASYLAATGSPESFVVK